MNTNLIKLLSVIFLSLVFISGCNQQSKYQSLMEEADKAMANLDVDKAISLYDQILEINPQNIEYGDGRLKVVRKLVGDAEQLKKDLETIKVKIDSIKAALKQPESLVDVENIQATFDNIIAVKKQLESVPKSLMYEEINNLEDKFISEVKNKAIQPLLNSIEEDTKSLAFDSVESNLSQLEKIQRIYPELVTINIDSRRKEIKDEKDKYIDFPTKIKKRDKVLFEGPNGKITFLGEGIKDNQLVLFYRFDGDLRLIADQIDLKMKEIYKDGEYTQNTGLFGRSSGYYRYFSDHTLLIDVVNNDATKQLVRLDYSVGLAEDQEQLTTLELEPNIKEQTTIQPVLRFGKTELSTKIVQENEAAKIEINKLSFKDKNVKVEGKLTPKKDMDLNTYINLYNPLYRDLDKKQFRGQYFAGVTKEFEYNFDMKSPIAQDVNFLKLYLLESVINIDIQTGKIYKPEGKELLINTIMSYDNDVNYSESLNENEQQIFANTDGKSVVNSIVFSGKTGFGGNYEPVLNIPLSRQYKKMAFDLSLEKNRPMNGSTDLTIMADGKVLKEVKMDSNFKLQPIELDINGVENITIKAIQQPVDYNIQGIMIGNGYLE